MASPGWNSGPPPGFVHKQAGIEQIADDRTGRFIASSNREDRYGDIVEQNWDLADFWKNPVFLFAHESWNPPIGWVREFTPNNEGTLTRARVEFLPGGKSARADELFELARIKAIKAVSVGFIPTEIEDRWGDDREWLGYRFVRNQLLELSLCTVPANADAVSLACRLNESPAFIRRVCADPEFSRPGVRPGVPPARELAGTFQRRIVAVETLRTLKGRYSPAVRPESRAAA